MTKGRPAVHNRRAQPLIRFRTEEMIKKQLEAMCTAKGVSVQEYMENLVKEEIVKFHTKKEEVL